MQWAPAFGVDAGTKVVCGLAVTILATSAMPLTAEDEQVLVTATRMQTPRREVASAVTVIDAEAIQRRGLDNVADVLRTVPGVEIARTGGAGQTASLFIRGASSERVKILIDGVEYNDPISPGRFADISHLQVDDIERIEIVRGPQSVLYGTDAIGGVINIITKRGDGPARVGVRAEIGSYQSFRESISANGQLGDVDYYLNLSRWDSGGFSSADSDDGNREDDGYENTSVTLSLSARPTEDATVRLILRHIDAVSEIDDFGGVGGDDPNHDVDSEQTLVRLEGSLLSMDDRWEQKLSFSYFDIDRTDIDHPDDTDPTFIDSGFKGARKEIEWQHNVTLPQDQILTFGVEFDEEVGSSFYETDGFNDTFPARSAETVGTYAQLLVSHNDRLFATIGVRYDDHEDFGSALTYRIAPACWLKDRGTKLKAAFGTGFKAPSLFQLFSTSGNPDLNEEDSFGWEIGIEQALLEDCASVELIYFDNDIDDLISYDSATFAFVNLGQVEMRGVECAFGFQATDDVRLDGHYTYLDAEDKETGEELVRRPAHRAGVDATWVANEKLLMLAGVLYVDDRKERDFSSFPATRVTLDRYELWHLRAVYSASERVEFFARVENILDEDYEEVSGFGSAGRSAYVGAKLQL